MKYQDYNMLLEYSGKPEDNNRFSETMQNLEKIFKYYLATDTIMADTVKFFTDLNKYKSIKTCDDFQKFLNTCYKKADESNAKLSKEYKDLDFDIVATYRNFKKLIKKFSVKYSTVTLEDKKKYSDIFEKYYFDIIETYSYFGSDWINKLNTQLRKLAEIDTDKEVRLVALINVWLKGIYDSTAIDLNNIRYVVTWLEPEIEHTLTFKLVQRFLKK